MCQRLQRGGAWYSPEHLPGFTDRKGVFRSTLLRSLLSQLSVLVLQHYLLAYPPCFLDEPYVLRVLMSYCDTRVHRGAIYREAEWMLSRVNARGIATYFRSLPSTPAPWDAAIRLAAARNPRSRRYRAARASHAVQAELSF